MLTHFTDAIASYAKVTTANHAAYARRHGYRYEAFRGHLSGDLFLMPGHEDPVRREGLYWQSFVAMERGLSWRAHNGAKVCDWLMWVDADAIFTDLNRSVSDLLQDWQRREQFLLDDVDVLLSREEVGGGAILNAGVMLLRNSPGGSNFLRGIQSHFEAVKDTHWADQRALHDHAFSSGPARWDPQNFLASRDSLRPEVKVLPQRAMNSFHMCPAYMYVGKNENKEDWAWVPGDFIAHFAGWKAPERVEKMCEMAREGVRGAPLG